MKKKESIPPTFDPLDISLRSSLRSSLVANQFEQFGRKDTDDHELLEMRELVQLTLPRPEAILNQTLEESTLRDNVISQYVETNRQFSRADNSETNGPAVYVSSLQKSHSKEGMKKSFRKKAPEVVYRNRDYPYFNLTLTFYNMRAPKKLLFPFYLVSLLVRCYTICYLIFIFWLGLRDREFKRWEWIIALVISRLLFIVLVFRVSLSMANSIVDTVLKNVWNRRENNLEEIFQRITFRMVMKCTQKAFTPPELCFVYLFKENKKRRLEMYYLINFIYISIEAIVFYPFVIGYSIMVLPEDSDLLAFRPFTLATAIITVGWVSVVLICSLLLLIKGFRISREIVK